MFYSISRLMQDFDSAMLGYSGKEELHSSNPSDTIKKTARSKIAIQLAATVIIIGVSAYIISLHDVGLGFKRISYIGIGIVIGYWLR